MVASLLKLANLDWAVPDDTIDQPLAIADRLSLDQQSFTVDLDPVAGTLVRHVGGAQVDPRGFRPEPRVAELGDGIGASGNGAHQSGRTVGIGIDCHFAAFWISKEQLQCVFKGERHLYPFKWKLCELYFHQTGIPMIRPRNLAPAPDRNAVLTKATLRAAERLGLSGRQLAEIVGLSEATVSRLKRGEATLDAGSKPFELAAFLVRVFRSLDAITGGDEAVARIWMTATNAALGARPVERMATVQGLVDVTTYLDARRAPV